MSGTLIEGLAQALGGNWTLVLVLIGLVVANGWQTRHFDKRLGSVHNRMESVEKRVKRTETYLMDRARADGGEVEAEVEYPQEADD